MNALEWVLAAILSTPAVASAQLQIFAVSLPDGTVGVDYGSPSLTADGGTAPYTFSLSQGSLPGGLSLASNGTFIGAPTVAGTFNFTAQVQDSSTPSALTATQAFSITVAPGLTITTPSPLPPGAIGVAYSLQFAASGTHQGYTQVWTIVDGIAPPGLVLSSDGSLTGTPVSPGTYNFTVQLAEVSEGPPDTVTGNFSITITSPPVSFGITTDPTLPQATVGTAYTAQFTTTGGQAPYVWTLYNGTLPPGLKLVAAGGQLTGTPTVPGTYIFTLSATDATEAKSSRTFVLTVVTSFVISTPSPLPTGAVGVSYSTTFSAAGGTAPYVWSASSGGALPPGLTLNPTSGNLTGVPTAKGSYEFIVTVADASQRTTSKSFVLNVTSVLTLVSTSPLTSAVVGVVYQAPLQASGGTPAYAWSVTSGALPDGLSLSATTGVISGTPTKAGTFNFQITVSDQSGGSANGAYVIVVSTALTITTSSPLPGGATGSPYTTTLSAAGGSPPYAWSIGTQSGALPPGLALDATGVLAGTPTANGSYSFAAVVTDAGRRTATKQFTISVGTKLVITTASPLPDGTLAVLYQVQFAATGGTQPYTWFVSSGALPGNLALDAATGILSGKPTSGGPFDVVIGVKDAAQTATKEFRFTIGVPALPPITITGLPDTPTPATQPSLGISIGAPYTLALTGHATLTFAPDANADDPAVQFTTGGRSADFQIAAGTTQALFGTSTLGLQTGTVAGTITVTLQLLAGGADVTPTPPPTRVVRIPGGPPVITSATLTANSSGFSLVVIGYATSREVSGATVHLTPTSGTKLASSDFTIPLTPVFTTWYQNAASVQFGSQFSLSIPFAVQNASSVIGSLNVTLTNAQGTSAAANAAF